MLKYMSVLLAVHDMAASKRFYTELLGCKILTNLNDVNVVLEGGVALQTLASWAGFCGTTPEAIPFAPGAYELYYETDDLDAFLVRLEAWPGVERLGGVKTFPWGQRSLKIADPDGHYVEVGEDMKVVCKRYLREGLSDEEVQKRVLYPIEFVQMCRAELEAE